MLNESHTLCVFIKIADPQDTILTTRHLHACTISSSFLLLWPVNTRTELDSGRRFPLTARPFPRQFHALNQLRIIFPNFLHVYRSIYLPVHVIGHLWPIRERTERKFQTRSLIENVDGQRVNFLLFL